MKTKKNDLSISDRADIVHRYIDGESCTSISKGYNTHEQTVMRLVKEAGHTSRCASYSHRTKSLNEKAFKVLTPESAYWVGFLMADGCVRWRTPLSARVTLSLQAKDRKHIEKYRLFLGSSHSITLDASSCKTRPNVQPKFMLSIASAEIARDLESYGVGPNKTISAQAKSRELVDSPHFWRGVVDGDGCIGEGTKGQAVLNLVGTKDLLTQFQAFVKRYCPKAAATPRKQENIYQLALGHRQAEEIVSVLYRGALISLERKQKIAETILSKADALLARSCIRCRESVPAKLNRRTKYCSAFCRRQTEVERERKRRASPQA
ncbi:hypothetical protein GCM10023185_29660 [Hymenobacter saemangeumensis]|uniref:DOD-type homing endonuclease domain-containing protein n=2 Tax=Hymenobacter saemangeumensis TaxID=1084522 RepID=A0ABP8IL27_9BACT